MGNDNNDARKAIDSLAAVDGFEFTRKSEGMPILFYQNPKTGMTRTYSLSTGEMLQNYMPRSLGAGTFHHPTESLSTTGDWTYDAVRGRIRDADNVS